MYVTFRATFQWVDIMQLDGKGRGGEVVLISFWKNTPGLARQR